MRRSKSRVTVPNTLDSDSLLQSSDTKRYASAVALPEQNLLPVLILVLVAVAAIRVFCLLELTNFPFVEPQLETAQESDDDLEATRGKNQQESTREFLCNKRETARWGTSRKERFMGVHGGSLGFMRRGLDGREKSRIDGQLIRP